MNLVDSKQVILYIIIAGFFFYLARAALDSIFIVAIPMDDDWCLQYNKDETKPEYEWVCLKYKNKLEQLKHYHNLKMIERNKYLSFSLFVIAFLLTKLIFSLIPEWKANGFNTQSLKIAMTDVTGIIFELIIAFVIIFITPWIFELILPPPAEWFPEVFREISNAQIEAKLRELKSIAKEYKY